ncbi:MAG: PucR family transcriptional regulator [Cyanophyceae cyanobacterium]
MVLTVRQALNLSTLAPARLVAGEAGLDNIVNWVHVVDMANAHYQWQRQGVLLLTAGFGLRDNREQQQTLVSRLSQLGFAGLVISVGHFFTQIPEIICQEANLHNFPLIETPPELLFINITEAILERIVNQQYTLLQQSTQLNQQLTDLVLQGGGLAELATTLARLLQRSITIESPTFSVLATAQHGAVDRARERSVERGRGTPEIVQHLVSSGVYDRLLAEMQPQHIAPIPSLGMTKERVVAPIIVNRELHGYIWIIAGDRPLTPLDELGLRHGATVAALMLFKEQSVRKAHEALQGDFFSRLLKGERTAPLLEQAQQLNYRLDHPHQVFVIASATASASTLHEDVKQWLHRRHQAFLSVWRENFLVVVLECATAHRGQQIALQLVEELQHVGQHLVVGIGNVSSPDTEIRQSYEQAREALQIGLALGQRAIAFADLGLLHWLYHLPAERLAENIYWQHVQTIAAYDTKRQAQLLPTLEAYLDRMGAVAETAEALFIHRNTLLHRLERIEKLCGLNLRAPVVRFNLYAAVKGNRLHG